MWGLSRGIALREESWGNATGSGEGSDPWVGTIDKDGEGRGGDRIRTDESRLCRPLPYHLATPPFLKQKEGREIITQCQGLCQTVFIALAGKGKIDRVWSWGMAVFGATVLLGMRVADLFW